MAEAPDDPIVAVIAKLEPSAWHLVDPGYLIRLECPLPSLGAQLYSSSYSHREYTPTSQHATLSADISRSN